MRGDLILYKSSGRWYERLIVKATRGPYVHVAIVVDPLTVIAARTQGILEQCKQALLLPEDYEVMGIYFRYYLFAWDIVVEAPGLPTPVVGEEIRSAMPVYCIENGQRKLVCIKVAQDHYQVLRVD